MIKQYDFVRVKKCNEEEFIGAEGIVKDVHCLLDNYYELLFIDRSFTERSIKLGTILFKNNELELI